MHRRDVRPASPPPPVVARPEGSVGSAPELESLIASAPVGVFRSRVGIGNVFVSEQLLEMFGRTRDEMLGHAWRQHLVPADQVRLTAALEHSRRGDDPFEAEYGVVRPDGTLRSFRVRAVPVREADGTVASHIGTVEDVTDRLEAERTVERLLELCERTDEFIALSSQDGRLLYLNASGRRLFGIPDDLDLDASDTRQLMRAAIPGDQTDSIVAALYEHGRWQGELEVIGHDGQPVSTWVTHTLHRDSAGEVTHVSSIGHDRTQEIERQIDRDRLAATIEAAVDFVTFHDLQGRVFYLNRAARDFFGVGESGESRADDIQRFLQLSSEQVTEITEAIFGEGLWRGTIAIREPGGERRPASVVVVSHRDAAGEVQYFSAITRDISEQVSALEALRQRDAQLQASEARYRSIVESQTDLVCRYLPDTTLTYVNPAFCEFYGGDAADWIGTPLIDVFPESDRARELARLADFGPQLQVGVQQDWEPRHDGTIRWYQWTDRATLDNEGRVVEFQSVGRDIHEEHLSAQLTERQAHILEMVARGEPLDATLTAITRTVESQEPDVFCSVMLVDADGATLRSGAAASLPADYVRAVDGVPIGPGVGTCGSAAFLGEPVVTVDIDTDPSWTEYRHLAAGAGLRSAWSTPLFTSSRSSVLGTLVVYGRYPGEPPEARRRLVEMLARLAEIAIERKQVEEQLAHDSLHDPLTQLPNRTLFLDRLGLALARSVRNQSRCAVVFLDLDGFKVVNDGLGHDAGDELLIAVARRLESVIRPGDTVARFGGDEFVVLCEDLAADASRADATEIAERLLHALARPFVIRDIETFIGASIGVALASDAGERPEDLLRDADAAMYEAKERGKQRVVVFDDALRERALSQHATFNALHRAIERDELRVYYQPIVSLTTGAVTGAEALVRWMHPERGLVPPSEFIGLAEQSDLIVSLGDWVLDRAVGFAAAAERAGGDSFSVSVNLSARQLAVADLRDRVAEVLDRHGLAPERLCLEITESVLMRDADATVGVIDELQALGVRVSIDDFGTGYSSLAYLKRFPVDSVKIDRSFVDGLPDDPSDAAIVTAVVSLAHALGLTVVAEGVESPDQLAALVRLGCDQAQGYWFARPQPVADLAELLASTQDWAPDGMSRLRRAG